MTNTEHVRSFTTNLELYTSCGRIIQQFNLLSTALAILLFHLLIFCKSGGPKASFATGYETWICKFGFKNLINLDFEVNKRQVPLNQKSKMNHESKSLSTWKLGCNFLLDTISGTAKEPENDR